MPPIGGAGTRTISGPTSDHFDGLRFFLPDQATDKSLPDVLRWQAKRQREPWPKSAPSPYPADHPPERVAGLRVVLIGHASYLVQVAGRNILIDPVFARRASPVRFAGPRRVNPPGIALADLPPIDAVLITHNHYDHLDGPSLARIWQAAPAADRRARWATTRSCAATTTRCTSRPATGASRSISATGSQVHLDAGEPLVGPGRQRPAHGAVVRLRDHLAPRRALPCRRYRLRRWRRCSATSAARFGRSAPRDPADRRLRAALVHAGAARKSRPRPWTPSRCSGAEPGARPPLGHLPAHRRGHRATRRGPDGGLGAARPAARAVPGAPARSGLGGLSAAAAARA